MTGHVYPARVTCHRNVSRVPGTGTGTGHCGNGWHHRHCGPSRETAGRCSPPGFIRSTLSAEHGDIALESESTIAVGTCS